MPVAGLHRDRRAARVIPVEQDAGIDDAVGVFSGVIENITVDIPVAGHALAVDDGDNPGSQNIFEQVMSHDHIAVGTG